MGQRNSLNAEAHKMAMCFVAVAWNSNLVLISSLENRLRVFLASGSTSGLVRSCRRLPKPSGALEASNASSLPPVSPAIFSFAAQGKGFLSPPMFRKSSAYSLAMRKSGASEAFTKSNTSKRVRKYGAAFCRSTSRPGCRTTAADSRGAKEGRPSERTND